MLHLGADRRVANWLGAALWPLYSLRLRLAVELLLRASSEPGRLVVLLLVLGRCAGVDYEGSRAYVFFSYLGSTGTSSKM